MRLADTEGETGTMVNWRGVMVKGLDLTGDGHIESALQYAVSSLRLDAK